MVNHFWFDYVHIIPNDHLLYLIEPTDSKNSFERKDIKQPKKKISKIGGSVITSRPATTEGKTNIAETNYFKILQVSREEQG